MTQEPKHSITIDGHIIPVAIRKHPRAKRITLRYQSKGHYVSVTLPRYASLKQGLRFAEEKKQWLALQIEKPRTRIAFTDGAVLPILGKEYRVVHAGGRGVTQYRDETVVVYGAVDFLARRLQDFLIAQARQTISELAQEKAALLGVSFRKITLRDTHSLWGRCTHDGHLLFSWRLVLAPYEVLDYVVAHEVAHLVHLNHSAAFWKKVAELCPDWQQHERWLKIHGKTLHQFG